MQSAGVTTSHTRLQVADLGILILYKDGCCRRARRFNRQPNLVVRDLHLVGVDAVAGVI